MQIPNLIFISIVAIYWIFIRVPRIIKRKLQKKTVEKERIKIIGELPLILSIIFYSVAIYSVIPKVLNTIPFLIGTLLLIFGIFFNEWARTILDKQWSGAARILQEHRLITKGPYSIVRHPMYLANAIMSIGCLFMVHSYVLFGLFFLMLAILTYRAGIEEQELLEKFGKEYEKYREKVSFVIPFVY